MTFFKKKVDRAYLNASNLIFFYILISMSQNKLDNMFTYISSKFIFIAFHTYPKSINH